MATEAPDLKPALLLKVPDVVCINLRRRPDRWQTFITRANEAGIGYVRRFIAVDGKDIELPHELKSHRGAYGCLHSHALAYREALRKGFSHLMVVEDDCVFLNGFVTVPDYIEATLGGFSYIHFGGGDFCYARHLRQFPTHTEVASVMNTHAYIADSSLMGHYVSYLEGNPFPASHLLHADRLIVHLCRKHKLKMCVPPSPLAGQDKYLTRDVEWGVPMRAS